MRDFSAYGKVAKFTLSILSIYETLALSCLNINLNFQTKRQTTFILSSAVWIIDMSIVIVRLMLDRECLVVLRILLRISSCISYDMEGFRW